jgi:hypothetical protein
MIRHANFCFSQSIPFLSVIVIKASFFGLLIATIGFTMLNQAGMLATFNTAINLPSLTLRTDKKDLATTGRATKALSEWSLTFLMHR